MVRAKCPNFITRHDFNHLPHDRTTMPKLKANFLARFHVFKLPWGCRSSRGTDVTQQFPSTRTDWKARILCGFSLSAAFWTWHTAEEKFPNATRLTVFLLVMPVSYTNQPPLTFISVCGALWPHMKQPFWCFFDASGTLFPIQNEKITAQTETKQIWLNVPTDKKQYRCVFNETTRPDLKLGRLHCLIIRGSPF